MVALAVALGGATVQKARAARQNDSAGAASPERKHKLQDEQRELRGRLAQLKKRLAQAEAAHSEASDALAESETAISAANRRLRELAQARREVQQQIDTLQEREHAVRSRQGTHELAVGQMMRTRQALAERLPWQEFLDGDDPGTAARQAGNVDVIVHAELRQIGDLRERHDELVALEEQSRQRKSDLASIAQQERTSRAQLLAQQSARKTTLARLSRDLEVQRRSIESAERDEARLGTLIDQITRVLAEQARRRPAPRSASKAQPHAAAPGLAAFDGLRGRLELPVEGQLVARFGAARRDEDGQLQPGAPAWKGLFIRAAAGTEVHAVAAGRVVFADWLRGFGNLIILDHGNGLLSVYGNNETLLRSIGDQVQARESIAAVGSTGGSRDSGLYFELRFQGKPFDPLAWVGPR